LMAEGQALPTHSVALDSSGQWQKALINVHDDMPKRRHLCYSIVGYRYYAPSGFIPGNEVVDCVVELRVVEMELDSMTFLCLDIGSFVQKVRTWYFSLFFCWSQCNLWLHGRLQYKLLGPSWQPPLLKKSSTFFGLK
jgi:hypothetical protein